MNTDIPYSIKYHTSCDVNDKKITWYNFIYSFIFYITTNYSNLQLGVSQFNELL